jgi:hypothetical protein
MLFIVRTIRNTDTLCVQNINFIMLKQVVHLVTTVLQKVNNVSWTTEIMTIAISVNV